MSAMALPAKLVEALESLHQDANPKASSDVWKAPAAEIQGAGDELSRSLDSWEAQRRDVKESGAELIETIQARLSAGAPTPSELDEAIVYFDEQEQRFKSLLQPLIKQAQDSRKWIFSLPVTVRPAILALRRRQIEVYARILETLRDLRWQLMTLRAQAEGPQDGPTFETPEALARYLETL